MTSQEDGIEVGSRKPARLDDHLARQPTHILHRTILVQAASKRHYQRLDVARRPALNDSPLRPAIDGQHAVVVQKSYEEAGGELPHAHPIGRPDRRSHRHDVMLDEPATVTFALQVFPQGNLALLFLIQETEGLAIEASDVGEHSPEARPQQVPPLREQAIPGGAVVFEPRAFVPHREAHLARLRRDPELSEQRGKARIGPFVVNNKTGVDLMSRSAHGYCVRMHVTADVVVGFINGHFAVTAKPQRHQVTGDSRPNDGDLQVSSVRAVMRRRSARGRSGTRGAHGWRFRIPALWHALHAADVVALAGDDGEQSGVVGGADCWGARHDPNIVPGLTSDDGFAVIRRQIDNAIVSLERPYKLHGPDGIAATIANEANRVIALLNGLRASGAKAEGGRYRTIGPQLVRLDRIVRSALQPGGYVGDHVPVAHEALQLHMRHRGDWLSGIGAAAGRGKQRREGSGDGACRESWALPGAFPGGPWHKRRGACHIGAVFGTPLGEIVLEQDHTGDSKQ